MTRGHLPARLTLAALLGMALVACAQPPSAEAQAEDAANPDGTSGTTIGFPTVASAWQALRDNHELEISVQDGWINYLDRPQRTLWSFVPTSHPAYPTVIKRVLVDREGGEPELLMDGLCEADEATCGELVRQLTADDQAAADAPSD